MPLQYLRDYELIVGEGERGLLITDLRIKFEVTKDLTSYPNLAQIQVYNLSKDSRARVEKDFTQCIFNAGYETGKKLLFKGQIRNVTHLKQGVDTITTIFAYDGSRDFDTAKTNITFKEGTNTKQIVEHVVSTFKETTKGVIQGLDNLKDKLSGVSLSGSSKDILDELGQENNFEWSINDGALNIIPKNQAIDRTIVITSATGMIGSPTITEIGADVTTLLNPEYIPNAKIKIESLTQAVALGDLNFRDINQTLGEGLYKIQKVTHVGDTHDTQWQSTLVGIRI